MKIVTYTAITNEKDAPRSDVVVFSDYNKFKDPVFNAKIFKIMPHKYLDCDVSIWIDGNIKLLIPPEQVVKEWLGDADIAFFRHYKSKNLDWELKWIKYKFNRRSEVYLEAEKQVKEYEKYGIKNEELAMGGVIIRRHSEKMERFNEAWWAEICRWGQRDQLSLPVILRKFPEIIVKRVDQDIKNSAQLSYEEHAHFES
ncbi:MAG: glycosyltransferase domain-containing protein [Patescibacteria group bacterium]